MLIADEFFHFVTDLVLGLFGFRLVRFFLCSVVRLFYV